MSESVKSDKPAKSVKSVTLKVEKGASSAACNRKSSKPTKIKGLKSDCSKASKSEKLIDVTDIDDEKCSLRQKPRIEYARRGKRKANQCGVVSDIDCEGDPAWRSYMKTLAADARKRVEEERETKCLYPDQKIKKFEVPCFPCPPKLSFRYELTAFNQGRRIIDVLGPTTADVWECIHSPKPCVECVSETSSYEWPRLAPCMTRDIVRERKILARKLKMRMLGASPCEVDEIDSPESSDDDREHELAHQKELIHARIPFTYRKDQNIEFVDRDCGETPGLVNGDYMLFELCSAKCGDRMLANVCLRGMTGMHLAELGRARECTWKFDMFQGLVALLAKTQLRYKYVWSANVDYIYNHAWMIFLHVGYLNIKPNQRFDDVLVYNYKYSVELQLVHELTRVRVLEVPFNYFEKNMKKQRHLPRKELTLLENAFSTERLKDLYAGSVHRETRRIEKWFDKLDDIYCNCIYRTPRFSLAFWQDGSFWYVYNPYRCDKFGLWEDKGYACFMKFCSKESLKRYLVLMTLRAYAYGTEETDCIDFHSTIDTATTKSGASSVAKRKRFNIQIYQLLYHSCHIHNVKLLLREPRKPRTQLVEKEPSELCTFDPLHESKPCDELVDDPNMEMEKYQWLEKKLDWAKNPPKSRCDGYSDPPMWLKYEVIKSKRLYILWGKNHILQKTYPEENRGKQAITCYAVCAGMCLINTPEYWESCVLDAIVDYGDKFYSERYKTKVVCVKKTKTSLPIDDWDERPTDKFRIGNMLFDIQAKPIIEGKLFFRNEQCLWQTLQRFFQQNTCGVLTCVSVQLAVFKHFGIYYIIDVASYGPPIFEKGQGMVYLLRATCFIDFMKNLVRIIGTPECRKFTIRPLEIIKMVDLGDADECGRVKIEKSEETKLDVFKATCPNDKKKDKRKPTKSMGGTKTFDQKVCLERESKLCTGMFVLGE